jgi:hypothetical protein
MSFKRSCFSLHIISSLIISGSIMCGTAYLFFNKTTYVPVNFKTNTLHTMTTYRQDIWSNLWQGLGIYFWNRYLPTWHKGLQPTYAQRKDQRKLFHYNLHIEHIIDTSSTIEVNHARPTIYFHGWGDTKNSAKLLKAFTDVLPGDLITFHFHDRGIIFPKLRHANLGQLPDVLSGIYVIKWAIDSLPITGVDLYGYSRGGATILNLIGVLNDDTGTYDADLAKLGIDAAERTRLLEFIQRGCIVLDCPLTDMNSAIEARMKKMTSHAIKALARVTKYQPDGLQGLSSAMKFEGLKLNILLHFQHHDTIVSNRNEAELYKRLYAINPTTTYVVLGNDGGHLHTHATLAHAIHTFKKKFGSSYDQHYDAQYGRTDHAHGGGLLQPGEAIDTIIAEYYASCAPLLSTPLMPENSEAKMAVPNQD